MHVQEGNERVYNKKMREEWKPKNGEKYTEGLVGKYFDKRLLIKVNLSCQHFHTKGFCL